MSGNYTKIITGKQSVQTKLPEQIPNDGGGFTYQLDKWKMLDRFLILGSDTPSYYASKEKLTFKNYDNALECLKADYKRTIDHVVEISIKSRAPKQDPALFCIALAMSCPVLEAKQYAASKVNDVARIGTNIMMLMGFLDDLRGRGRIVIKMLQNWFEKKEPSNIVQQVIKYRNREGWTPRDLLRVARIKTKDETKNAIYNWVVKGWKSVGVIPHSHPVLARIWAFERAKSCTNAGEIAKLISEYALPWEAVDNKWLKEGVIWDTLLEHIKPEALIRSLGKLSANGLTAPNSDRLQRICEIITNKELLLKSKVHPLKILVALKTYENGHGDKGSLSWQVSTDIVDALNEAFDLSFGSVEPTGKKIIFCLDISGSMGGAQIAGMPITAREASGAMAMISHRVESQSFMCGFSNKVIPLNIGKKDSFSTVIKKISNLDFGRTNIGSAIEYALANKIPADAFVIITDNEGNSGNHPHQCLLEYRRKTGINAKMVVMATSATNYTIADPKDGGELDVVGFDSAVPQIMSDFIAERI